MILLTHLLVTLLAGFTATFYLFILVNTKPVCFINTPLPTGNSQWKNKREILVMISVITVVLQ